MPSPYRGTVAFAVTIRERRGCLHENPPPSPGSRYAVRLGGLPLPADVIVLAIRWYLRFGLSYRDVEELLTERGVKVDHVTTYRWVLRFAPLLADAGHAATPWVTASFGSSTSAGLGV